MRKISITEALNDLKLYDSKIDKAIKNAKFIGVAKKSSDKVKNTKKENFVENAKASYQSVTDLINNRNALKSAIVKSNAVAVVEVNGKTMTVAEAIEHKNSIEYELNLLESMKTQYATEIAILDRENKKVDNKVDELLTTLVGRDGDKKISKEELEAVETPYRNKNEYELVDPLSIYDKMLELEAEIDGFLSEVDTRLSIANSTTFIELDF